MKLFLLQILNELIFYIYILFTILGMIITKLTLFISINVWKLKKQAQKITPFFYCGEPRIYWI